MQGTQVWPLGQEGPLEKEMATHSGILAWRTPWTEEPGELQSMKLQRVRYDWTHVHFEEETKNFCIYSFLKQQSFLAHTIKTNSNNYFILINLLLSRNKYLLADNSDDSYFY